MKLKTAPTMPTTVSTSNKVPANWFLDSLTRYPDSPLEQE